MANQRARVNYYKNEIYIQESYMDSISKNLHVTIDSIDSLNEVLRNRLKDYDSMSTRLITMEQWLYDRSVDNSYLYYSYLESTVKFIDLGSYVLYGTRRDGSFGLIRRGPTSEDLEWKKTFVSYANKLNQPIVPVYIDGKLSNFFYRLANFRKAIGIKANIEMLYLADELFNQRNKTIKFTIGKPIISSDYQHLPSERKQTAFIKQQVYELANN
jgi:hypothetical protein